MTPPAPEPLFAWNESRGGGTLELHEAVTAPGPALELVFYRAADGHTVAAWITDQGVLLRFVEVGNC